MAGTTENKNSADVFLKFSGGGRIQAFGGKNHALHTIPYDDTQGTGGSSALANYKAAQGILRGPYGDRDEVPLWLRGPDPNLF